MLLALLRWPVGCAAWLLSFFYNLTTLCLVVGGLALLSAAQITHPGSWHSTAIFLLLNAGALGLFAIGYTLDRFNWRLLTRGYQVWLIKRQQPWLKLAQAMLLRIPSRPWTLAPYLDHPTPESFAPCFALLNGLSNLLLIPLLYALIQTLLLIKAVPVAQLGWPIAGLLLTTLGWMAGLAGLATISLLLLQRATGWLHQRKTAQLNPVNILTMVWVALTLGVSVSLIGCLPGLFSTYWSVVHLFIAAHAKVAPMVVQFPYFA